MTTGMMQIYFNTIQIVGSMLGSAQFWISGGVQEFRPETRERPSGA